MSFEGEVVNYLEHGESGRHPVEVPPDGLEMLDGFDLVHDVELAPAPAHHRHVGQRLEPAGKAALGLSDPLGDRPDLAVLKSGKGHDPIGFPEANGPEHYGLVAVGGHLTCQVLIRAPSEISDPEDDNRHQKGDSGLVAP